VEAGKGREMLKGVLEFPRSGENLEMGAENHCIIPKPFLVYWAMGA